jgi:hypothetical protein
LCIDSKKIRSESNEILHSMRRVVIVKSQNAARYLATLTAVFVVLSAAILVPLMWIGFLTGALLLPEEMGAAQSHDPNIVAEPFSLRYWAALKIRRIAKDQPEIVSIGSSRGMAMRSAMFTPYKFYNASLTAWTLDQEIIMIDQITQVSKPRVIIIGIDYFMFTNRYADAMARERTMIFGNGWRYRYESCLNLLREFWSRPTVVAKLIEDWWHGKFPIKSDAVTLLGIDAIRGITGFRFDGSMLLPRATYAQAPKNTAANEGLLQAAPGGPSIDTRQYQALERLAAFGRQRGITLVAIQFPILKATVDFLDNDKSYHNDSGIWREFEGVQMGKMMKDLGFIFFDMSRDSISADSELFIDAAHLTESGMSVTITHLLDDARFRAQFPDISAARLRMDRARALERGDRFEVYGNRSGD